MNAALGWVLAVAAIAVGYAAYGWRGVVLALSIVVFWLLLQFSRALRALRNAAGRPLGSTASAVMLNAKLRRGMRLTQILALTGSLGEPVSAGSAAAPETFIWRDAGGDAVRAELTGGRLGAWRLERAPAAGDEA